MLTRRRFGRRRRGQSSQNVVTVVGPNERAQIERGRHWDCTPFNGRNSYIWAFAVGAAYSLPIDVQSNLSILSALLPVGPLFSQYRIKSLKISFIQFPTTMTFAVGIDDTAQAVGGATPSLLNDVIGMRSSALISSNNQSDNYIEWRPSSNQWYYTSSAAPSATLSADDRLSSPANIWYFATGTGSGNATLIIDYSVVFRGRALSV